MQTLIDMGKTHQRQLAEKPESLLQQHSSRIQPQRNTLDQLKINKATFVTSKPVKAIQDSLEVIPNQQQNPDDQAIENTFYLQTKAKEAEPLNKIAQSFKDKNDRLSLQKKPLSQHIHQTANLPHLA